MSSPSDDRAAHDSLEARAEAGTPPHAHGIPEVPRRLRVTQRDLDVYAALVGVPQSLVVEGAAEDAAEAGSRAGTARAASAASRAWSATVRVAGPELSAWVRRLSRDAKQQLRQARARMAAGGRRTRA